MKNIALRADREGSEQLEWTHISCSHFIVSRFAQFQANGAWVFEISWENKDGPGLGRTWTQEVSYKETRI